MEIVMHRLHPPQDIRWGVHPQDHTPCQANLGTADGVLVEGVGVAEGVEALGEGASSEEAVRMLLMSSLGLGVGLGPGSLGWPSLRTRYGNGVAPAPHLDALLRDAGRVLAHGAHDPPVVVLVAAQGWQQVVNVDLEPAVARDNGCVGDASGRGGSVPLWILVHEERERHASGGGGERRTRPK
eukprot:4912613-Pyramimonas_sp.AAC.2